MSKPSLSSPSYHAAKIKAANSPHQTGITGGKLQQRSVGEELYLVHLSRFSNPTMDDLVDRESKQGGHNSMMSVGEALWKVHCQRSQGCEPDYDADNEKGEEKIPSHTKAQQMRGIDLSSSELDTNPTKRGRADDDEGGDRVLWLRNRTVKIARVKE